MDTCPRVPSYATVVVCDRSSADDDRTHLLFSLLDGLRLIIPQFSVDQSATERRASALIPGVHYVFYKPPRDATTPPSAAPSSDQQRRPRVPRALRPAKSRSKDDDERLDGLYDRRQVKRSTAVKSGEGSE